MAKPSPQNSKPVAAATPAAPEPKQPQVPAPTAAAPAPVAPPAPVASAAPKPAPAAAAPTPTAAKQEAKPGPTHEQIARRAYEIYTARGADHGRHDDDWLQAERELKLGKQ